MYLEKVTVHGYKAAWQDPLECILPGRFAVLAGPNGSGKSTVVESILLAHREVFPYVPRTTSAALSASVDSRSIQVEYAFDDPDTSPLGIYCQGTIGAPQWSTVLSSSMGRVSASQVDYPSDGSYPILYLSPTRNPAGDLAGRDARLLVELLRAQAYRDRGDKSLSQLRRRLRNAVGSVVANWPIEDAEARVAVALAELTDGVSGYAPFLATTAIDDTFLARVFEFLLAPTGVDRFDANRLEVEGLGYANLLQLAVILATIPDLTYEGAGSGTQSPDREFDEQSANGTNSNVTTEGESLEDERSDADRRAEMEEAAEQRIIEDDTFFANNFHAIVLLEEPEAHLHPQLQHGLVSHLKTVVQDRPEVQVIVTTHSDEIVSACDPEDLVVFRRTPNGQPISRTIKSFGLKAPRLAMARRHLDVTRSAALFAERAVLVEGTTDAIVLRAIARIWAGSDPVRARFVEALTITVVGSRIGPWLPDLLAHPGKEICARLALLQDSDGRPVPNWITKREGERFGVFLSEPTLEPSLVDGNEALFEKLFESLKIEKPWTAKEGPTPESIVKWLTGAGRQRKAILADRFSALASNRPESVSIPQHMSKLLDFLWEGFRQEHQAIEANC